MSLIERNRTVTGFSAFEVHSTFMDSFRELGRALLFFGVFIALVGAFFYLGGKLPFRLGRLPGDIVHRSERATFYFPIMTSILLSVALTLLFWFIGRIRR
jgi:hypothetical protein